MALTIAKRLRRLRKREGEKKKRLYVEQGQLKEMHELRA